jgi:hypothetical protein
LLLALYSLPIENPSSLEPVTGLSELFPSLSLSLSLSLSSFRTIQTRDFFYKTNDDDDNSSETAPATKRRHYNCSRGLERWPPERGRRADYAKAAPHARTHSRSPARPQTALLGEEEGTGSTNEWRRRWRQPFVFHRPGFRLAPFTATTTTVKCRTARNESDGKSSYKSLESEGKEWIRGWKHWFHPRWKRQKSIIHNPAHVFRLTTGKYETWVGD